MHHQIKMFWQAGATLLGGGQRVFISALNSIKERKASHSMLSPLFWQGQQRSYGVAFKAKKQTRIRPNNLTHYLRIRMHAKRKRMFAHKVIVGNAMKRIPSRFRFADMKRVVCKIPPDPEGGTESPELEMKKKRTSMRKALAQQAQKIESLPYATQVTPPAKLFVDEEFKDVAGRGFYLPDVDIMLKRADIFEKEALERFRIEEKAKKLLIGTGEKKKKVSNDEDEDDDGFEVVKESPKAASTEGAIKATEKQAEVINNAFTMFNLHPKLIDVLNYFKLTDPTEIQSLAIPYIIKRHSIFMASESGSGKTLAYVLPLIHNLFVDNWGRGIFLRRRQPRALILLPTGELVHQVYNIVKRYAEAFGMRTVKAYEGSKDRRALKEPTDIVITTPMKYLMMLDSDCVSYGDTRHLVIDEADMLFDIHFDEDIIKILNHLQKPEKAVKLETIVVSTAIVSKSVHRMISTPQLKHLHIVTSSNLHRPVKHLRQHFIHVKDGPTTKKEYIINTIAKNMGCSFMIFCNRKEDCLVLHKYLREHRVQNMAVLHGGINAKERQVIVRKAKLKEIKILICSDMMARGIDIKHIDRVVNYDFPLNVLDYLHRAGRTARGGRGGLLINLIGNKDLKLARYIKLGVSKNIPFDRFQSEDIIEVPTKRECIQAIKLRKAAYIKFLKKMETDKVLKERVRQRQQAMALKSGSTSTSKDRLPSRSTRPKSITAGSSSAVSAAAPFTNAKDMRLRKIARDRLKLKMQPAMAISK